MAEHSLDVGIVIARRKLGGPWADHAWLPHAVLPAVPATAPGTRLGGDDSEGIFYAGASTLRLYASETAHYRDNLASGRPALWVVLQPVAGDVYEVAAVTADPYEGEALTQGNGEIVEAVPMPAEIGAAVAAFVAAFHVERPFTKRRRDRADPEALARGTPDAAGTSRPKRRREDGA
jgi:Protein of unknown function (DUF3305)